MDEQRRRLVDAVVTAARQYRQTMAHYIGEQTRLMDEGAALDEVANRNWAAFEETARAEEALYATLDALDQYDASV